jgi:hypothetical protein
LQNSSHLDGANLQPNRGLPSDKDGHSHSFTLVSRPFLNQPQCWNLPASDNHDLPLSFTDPVSCSRNLPAFSPHESESSESGDESITLRLKATSATLIPWNEILGLDRQVSGQIDPFMTYPSHLGAAPEVVDACQNYCSLSSREKLKMILTLQASIPCGQESFQDKAALLRCYPHFPGDHGSRLRDRTPPSLARLCMVLYVISEYFGRTDGFQVTPMGQPNTVSWRSAKPTRSY